VAAKSRPIAAALALITTSQLALGIYRIYLAATHAGGHWMFNGPVAFLIQYINATVAQTVPSIPFDGFKICIFSRHRKMEIAYTGISLAYGKTFQNSPCFQMVTTPPVLERFTRVLDYPPSGRSVDDPTIQYSGSTWYDSEGCHEILPCDLHDAFRLRHDPPIR